MADLSGKNLKFLSGTQASLDTLRTNGGATEGAFYLTNDTHRLYIGTTEDSKVIPVPVNEGVVTVKNIAALPTTGTAGHFYYASDDSVLCVWSKGQWVQINPDTTIKTFTTTVGTKDTTNKTVEITETIADSRGTDHTNSGFKLKEGAGVTLTTDGNIITIGSSGTGAITQEVSTVQDANDTKTVEVQHHTIVKKPDGTTQSDTTETIDIVGGSYIDTVTAGTKQVTINAKKQEVSDLKFNNETEGFSLTAFQTSGNDITSSVKLNPSVKYGYDIDTDFTKVTETGTEQEAKFSNGAADLNVFTAKQTSDLIDKRITSKLAVADAMTFKGVIETGQTTPDITTCHNGDTYKVAGTLSDISNITSQNGTIKVGDLLIASGTEDATTGLLTTGSFIHVPSGNEYETQTRKIEHGLEIIDSSESHTLLGGIVLKAGSQIALSDTDASDALDREITVAHGAITTTPTTADNTTYGTKTDNKKKKTITVVKSITTDNGHVTGITTANEVIEDTDIALSSLTHTAAEVTADKEVKITTAVLDAESRAVEGTLNLKSETIKLTPDTSTVSMDIVWGSF